MLQEVASLNKRAIEYLGAERHDEAVAAFWKAMHIVHQYCVRDFEIDVLRAIENALRVGHMAISEVRTSPCTTFNVVPSDTNDVLFEVYTRPFLIDASVVVPPSVLFVTLSFNVGLVYHRLGLQRNSLDYLKNAIHYYEYGLSIINQNSLEGYCSNGMYWLTLALLTNVGNILWSLWCTSEAIACQKRVHLLIGTKQIFTLPPEDIEFFLDVSSSGIFCSRNVAPAA